MSLTEATMRALVEMPPPPALPPRRYRLTRVSSTQPRPITWLLPGRIPFGALTLLAGRPGTGKSTFSLALAAQLSQRGVASILLGSEDGVGDTVHPRLLAAGADTEHVHVLDMDDDAMVQLPTDVPYIAEAVKETGAGLLVLDPAQAHLAPEINSNVDSSLRQAMAPLARMAQETGAAVVLVTHLRKSTEGSSLDRVGGSGGWGGIARSALLFGKDRHADPWTDTRYACHIKANGAALAPALECRIEGYDVRFGDLVIPSSRLVMEREVTDLYASDIE